jgi:hypothetical protein
MDKHPQRGTAKEQVVSRAEEDVTNEAEFPRRNESSTMASPFALDPDAESPLSTSPKAE